MLQGTASNLPSPEKACGRSHLPQTFIKNLLDSILFGNGQRGTFITKKSRRRGATRHHWEPQMGVVLPSNPCHPLPVPPPMHTSFSISFFPSFFSLSLCLFYYEVKYITFFGTNIYPRLVLINFWSIFRTFLGLIRFIHRGLVSFGLLC